MAEVLVFRSSRFKAIWLFMGSVAFVCLGVWMAQEKPVIGWLCAAFFVLGIPASIAILVKPEVFYLRLDPEGFEMGSPIRQVRTRWAAVDRFEMGSIRGASMIAIRYKPTDSAPLMRNVSAALAGMEGAIPNNYDHPLPAILTCLQEWHARYGAVA